MENFSEKNIQTKMAAFCFAIKMIKLFALVYLLLTFFSTHDVVRNQIIMILYTSDVFRFFITIIFLNKINKLMFSIIDTLIKWVFLKLHSVCNRRCCDEIHSIWHFHRLNMFGTFNMKQSLWRLLSFNYQLCERKRDETTTHSHMVAVFKHSTVFTTQ